MPFYDDDVFKLDDESRKFAKSLGEDPAQKLSQIEVLRTWIMSHTYLECRTDDKFLLMFLRVAKFSCEAAKERIINYCVARSSKLDGLPEWFTDLNVRDPKIRELLEIGAVYVVPRVDSLGRVCLVFDMECFKGVKTDAVNIVRAFYLAFHFICWKYERCQVNGWILIVDGSNFSLDLAMYVSPEKMKKNIFFLQEAFPFRWQLLEFYNMSPILRPFIESIISVCKPDTKNIVHVHSDRKPPEGVPPECMPKSMGGTCPAFSELKGDFMRQLEDFQSELDSLKTCKVDVLKMPKHYEEGDSWGISGSYRTIQA